MQLELPQDAILQIASAAITKALDQDSRDNIIAQAVREMITPRESPYSSNRKISPLQEAFTRAVDVYLREQVERFIKENDEMQAHIQRLLEKGWAEFKSTYMDDPEEEEKLVKSISSAISSHLNHGRWR